MVFLDSDGRPLFLTMAIASVVIMALDYGDMAFPAAPVGTENCDCPAHRRLGIDRSFPLRDVSASGGACRCTTHGFLPDVHIHDMQRFRHTGGNGIVHVLNRMVVEATSASRPAWTNSEEALWEMRSHMCGLPGTGYMKNHQCI